MPISSPPELVLSAATSWRLSLGSWPTPFYIMHAEVLPSVCPDRTTNETTAPGQRLKSVNGILVGVLGVQALALLEAEGLTSNRYCLGHGADQMHFYTVVFAIEHCAMDETLRVQISIQLSFKTPQQVKVERSRYPGRIVVGGL